MLRWGVIGVGIVAFDIDYGQKIERIYPDNIHLSATSKQNIAYLALPHTSKESEGDTQYCFRYRIDTEKDYANSLEKKEVHDHAYHYGFVLFRQQKDASLARGYFQKSFVLLTSTPFPSVFEHVVQIAGQFVFQHESNHLSQIYDAIQAWPTPIEGSTMKLSLMDHQIRFTIPNITNQEHTYSSGERKGPRLSIGETPSLDDLFGTLNAGNRCLYQEIGLFSSFPHFESQLWRLWQIALLGEPLLILAPNARVASEAVLGFVSLIDPIPYHGDYRSYFTLYDPDFKSISDFHQKKRGLDFPPLVLGTTDPFFPKSLEFFPNALYLPEGLGSADTDHRDDVSVSGSKHISKGASLDKYDLFSQSHPKLLTRRSSLVPANAAVLKNLLTLRPDRKPTSGSTEAEGRPLISINNVLLRQHFQQLTKDFLKPFERYFGLWSRNFSASSKDQQHHHHHHHGPYASPQEFLLPFREKEFLKSLELQVHPNIRKFGWKKLYQRFLVSPHFLPWFQIKRQDWIDNHVKVLRLMRVHTDVNQIIRAKNGNFISIAELQTLKQQILKAIAREEINPDSSMEPEVLDKMKEHLAAVQSRLPKSIFNAISSS